MKALSDLRLMQAAFVKCIQMHNVLEHKAKQTQLGNPDLGLQKIEGTALSAVLRGARSDQGSGYATWNKRVFQPQRFSGRNCVLCISHFSGRLFFTLLSGLVEHAAHEISVVL